jgi:hypothetical protein
VPQAAPHPRRDTTPPSGIRRVTPTAPDELDLAGLVASVDDEATDTTEADRTDGGRDPGAQP